MTDAEMTNLWITASNQLSIFKNAIPPQLLQQCQGLTTQISSAAMSGNSQQAKLAFQSFWALALNEVKNPAMLRAILPCARPALGVVGCAWGEIEVACLAITGVLASELILDVVLVIAAAILLVLLILLIFYVLKWAMNWNPGSSSSPPMQTPHWNRLIGMLNDPSYGPVYAIKHRSAPLCISA